MDRHYRKIFSQNLRYYMKLNEKDRNDLVKDLGFPYSSVRDWEKGICYAKIDKIEILANYFGIPKSKLIEDNNTAHIIDILDTTTDHKLIENIMVKLPKLTDEQLKHILKTVDLLLISSEKE